MGGEDCDIIITEIGGVVGDIESLPFLEAIREMALEEGRGNVLFVHVSLIPFIKAAGELKTKPTQQSVAKLREIGIQPDVLVCRTEHPLDEELKQKVSMFCNVERSAVIEEIDMTTSIYEMPIVLKREGMDVIVLQKLGLKTKPYSLQDWENIVEVIKHPDYAFTIAVVGKYTELHDAYKSIYEALAHAGIANHAKVIIKKVDSEDEEHLEE